LGKTDIWRVHLGEKMSPAENLGPKINTSGDEYEPLPLRDGKTLIIMAADGLYHSKFTRGSWALKMKFGPDVNVNGTEIGALVSERNDVPTPCGRRRSCSPSARKLCGDV
jgi:hypothetical protein